MRADICDPSNASAVARFRAVLRSMSAELIDHHESSLGVDLWQFRVNEAVLSVFADAWSLDIEGPPEIVERVVIAMQTADIG